MANKINDDVVRHGVWSYDNAVRCLVKVVRRDVMYGTADDEDPPELHEDGQVECFEVLFGTAQGEGPAFSSGGQFLSLEDAIRHVEDTVPGPVKWEDVS